MSPLDSARVTRDGEPVVVDLSRLVCDVQSFARWSNDADPSATWVVEIDPSTSPQGFRCPGCVWRVQGGAWTCTTSGVVYQGEAP